MANFAIVILIAAVLTVSWMPTIDANPFVVPAYSPATYPNNYYYHYPRPVPAVPRPAPVYGTPLAVPAVPAVTYAYTSLYHNMYPYAHNLPLPIHTRR